MIRGTLGCLDICVEKDSNGPRLDTTSLISQVILVYTVWSQRACMSLGFDDTGVKTHPDYAL